MKRVLLLLAVLFLASFAHAARLEVSTGDAVDIHIAVGVPTVVTFPEGIKAIPTSADPGALSLEIEGKRLFIQSLREGFSATLFVVGESGRLHLLRLVEHDPPDTEVQLILPQAPPRFEEAASGRLWASGACAACAGQRDAAPAGGDAQGGEAARRRGPGAQPVAGLVEGDGDSNHAPVRGGSLPGLSRHGAQPDGQRRSCCACRSTRRRA